MRPHEDQTTTPPPHSEPVIDLERAAERTRPGVARSLASLDVEERRGALRDLLRWGLADEDVGLVIEALLDPDPGVRLMAVEILVGHADRVDDATVLRALRDPIDQVRRAAVSLSAAREAPHLDEIISLLSSARWPLARRAALRVLPRVIHHTGLDESGFSALLRALATPSSPPAREEQEALAEIARAVGRDPLVEALALADGRRLGAVRLLMAWGVRSGLRELTALASDPLSEIRRAARSAAAILAEESAGTAPLVPATIDISEPGRISEAEVIEALIRGLQDPDPIVRDRTWGALALAGWDHLLAWVRRSLTAGDDELAALAAVVSGRLMLSQTAGEILNRGGRVPPTDGAPFVDALTSFDLDASALVAMLSEVDREARPGAVRIVGEVGGTDVLPLLRPLLADDFGPVRRAVLEAFEGWTEAEDTALEVLRSDPSSSVRSMAVRVIRDADASRRLEGLARAVRDPDAGVRAEAVRVLPAGLGPDALPSLLTALGDADESVWTAAIERLSDPARARAEVWAALRACAPERRRRFLESLSAWERRDLTDLSLAHHRSPDATDRALALEVGLRAGGLEMLRVIVDALADPDAQVRRVAATAIEEVGAPSAIPQLGRALADPDPEVRAAAARALGSIDDRTATTHLLRALVDREPLVRAAAASAFERLRPDFEALVSLAESWTREGRAITPELRALLHRENSLSSLMVRLGSLDPELRRGVVDVVAAVGGDAAVDALTHALSDPDPDVRMRVLERLGDLHDPRTRAAIERTAQTDPIREVAELARKTLARLRFDDGVG